MAKLPLIGMYEMRLISVLVCVSLLFPPWASAGVYQCRDQSGTVEFRDKPCIQRNHELGFLPYVYKKTEIKTQRAQEKDMKQLKLHLSRQDKAQQRLKKQQTKALYQELKKTERKERQCEAVQEKLRLIQEELRHGCTLRRCEKIKIKKEQLERKNKHLCVR